MAALEHHSLPQRTPAWEAQEVSVATLRATITPEERARRQAQIDGARANVGLEGFVPDAATEERARQYVAGEITLAEFVDVRHDQRGAR